jgi:acyl dehydratase
MPADGYDLAFGTYQDALAWVGYRTEPVTADVPVEIGLVKAYAAMLEDPTPTWWDEGFSRKIWGHQIAQAGLLIAVFSPLRWYPDKTPLITVSARVPLPGATLINAGTEQTFERPLRVGDRLTMVEEVTSVSELKKTRLGTGHFVVTTAYYTDSDGEPVARNVNTLFRYTPVSAGQER